MKNFIVYIFLLFTCVFSASAQLDRSVRPQPGPAPVIQLGDFDSFTLENGLQVIVVENRKIPVVSFQLTLDIKPILEGEAKGYVDLSGQLMREGTINRSKQQIDESIDFIGANLSTYSTGMFASSLTRHKDVLLELMADVLLNPTFPGEELQRRIVQTRSALQTVKTDGGSIANNLAVTNIYGTEHPYGEVTTEENLDNITVDLLRDYYQTYFRPNVAYMVIVGDMNVQEAREVMEKYFSGWQRADVPQILYPIPTPPQSPRVVFADRIGASQSTIVVGYPVELTPGHPDAIKADVMNSILGGGVFSSRLMMNIREDKGWSYGARSSLTNNPIVGRFQARTEVRNSVTDSAVVEILHEMTRMIEESVDPTNLQLTKNFMNGSFARSLENPRTIANFALNIKRYNLPEDYYATYLEKLSAVSVEDVSEMAARYIKPNNVVIAVAGNKNEVPETLARFAGSGEVEFFDAFGRPLAQEREVEAGVTLETVMDRYFEAVGGRENFSKINNLTQVMKTNIMGMELQITSFQKAPDQLRVETSMGGNVMATQIFDGTKAVVKSPMGVQEFTEGPEFEMMKMQAILNMELNYEDYGFTKTLAGIETVDGKDAYKVEVTSPAGETSLEYYDVESGLKVKTESAQGSAKISDYRTVAMAGETVRPSFFGRLFGKKPTTKTIDLKFPHHIEQQAGPQALSLEVLEIKVNSQLEEEKFSI
jgi:zinc protease